MRNWEMEKKERRVASKDAFSIEWKALVQGPFHLSLIREQLQMIKKQNGNRTNQDLRNEQ